ncbi:MAG: hypothetical protein ISR68_02510 [Campylobacterales bacterium]|nr:hypothetical protein [Campylobacterales bacterium]
MKKNKILLSLATAALVASSAYAGPKLSWNDGESSMELFQMVQVWGMNTVEDNKDKYENTSDLYIRRGRIGVKGKVNADTKYKVWFAYDNLGKGSNNILMGTPHDNTNANKDFYIWDAYFEHAFDKEYANVSFGYFRPQVGKESITSGFTINSYEKGLSNFYYRKHIVGRGPGREVGINLGGLTMDKKLNYNFGIFNPNNTAITGADTKDGVDTSRTLAVTEGSWMYAARVAYSFGDAEMKKYKMGYTTNYFGKRNGTTIGLNYTYQDESQGVHTDDDGNTKTVGFKSNSSKSIDMLSNYGNLNISAERDWLERETLDGTTGEAIIDTLRVGYNIKLANGKIVEPAVLYTKADLGDTEHFGDVKAYSNGTAGNQTIKSIGLNYYRKGMKEKYSVHLAEFDKTDGGGEVDKVLTFGAQYIF